MWLGDGTPVDHKKLKPPKGIDWLEKTETPKVEEVYTCDPPEMVNACLNCTVPGGCHDSSPLCGLKKIKGRGRGAGRFKTKKAALSVGGTGSGRA